MILAPGGRFDKASWEAQALRLTDEGFRVLAINLRGRGESTAGTEGGDASVGGDALSLDVLAAIQYLRETGVSNVAILAASLGGWAAAGAVTASEPGAV